MRRPQPYWFALPSALAVAAAVLFAQPNPHADPVAAGVGDALDAERAAIARRTAAKTELISALIEGRLSLAQVTAEVLRLAAENEPNLVMIRMYYAGATDEERVARNVIYFVSLRDLPADEKARVLARLERDFAGLVGPTAPAVKQLPPPPSSRP